MATLPRPNAAHVAPRVVEDDQGSKARSLTAPGGSEVTLCADGVVLVPDPYPGFYQVDGSGRPLTTQGEAVLSALQMQPASADASFGGRRS